MSSSVVFTGPSFSVASVSQLGVTSIRVSFTGSPLATNPAGANDALNPSNYLLTGPASNAIASVAIETSSSVILTTSSALVFGLWTVTAQNIQTPSGGVLVAPTFGSFNAPIVSATTTIAAGGQNDDAYAILRKHLSPALKGNTWESLLYAFSRGDQYNYDLAQAAWDQKFLSTASGMYLTRKAADVGIDRPGTIGIAEEVFRTLAIKTTAGKLTIEVILEVLEAYYGSESVRANCTSTAFEPFALQDGDTLLVQTDEGTVSTIIFATDDFASIGAATAQEVSAVITRTLRRIGNRGYAVEFKDPSSGKTYVQIFSGALGLVGSVRIRGGRAQNTLIFPTRLLTTQAITTAWKVEPSTSSNGIPAGRVRYTWIAGTDPSLQLVNVGDYANIYGSGFNTVNRGAFGILASAPTYFEIANTDGVLQLTVVQSAVADVYFYTPVRSTIQSFSRMATAVQGDPDQLDIILPATTQAIERGPNIAAYLHANPALIISAISRIASGLVTATSTGHGLTSGQWVEIDGVYPDTSTPATYSWGTADPGNIAVGTVGSAMTLLADGRVLSTGGSATSAFIYNPSTNTWSAATSMLASRSFHTLTTLSNGKVLVVGGSGTTACELYDPNSNTWTSTTPANVSRTKHSATLLQDGRVLVVGGNASANAEIYNPANASWTATAAPVGVRSWHTATLLYDGRVLVAGGHDAAVTALNTSEIYNPISGVWVTCGTMTTARYAHTGALINFGFSGGVLVTGGTTDGTNGLTSCQIFTPGTLSWSAGPALTGPRFDHTLTTLSNGILLAAGGIHNGTVLATVEQYNPVTNSWAAAVSMGSARRGHRAVLLANGKVLVRGYTATFAEAYSSPFSVVAAGGFNGLFQVTVTGANAFTYSTPDYAYVTTGLAGGTATPIRAVADTIPGPFIFDPKDGAAITAIETACTQNLVQGQTYNALSVMDASSFPDANGYLVFGFGTDKEVRPVRYLGRISNTQLLLDPSFVFPMDLVSGISVTLLAQRAPFEPENPETVGSFYLTASAAGRVAAEATLDNVVAAGVEVNKIIKYPGDRGLGNEGYPTSGADKLSDQVQVWGSDNLDTDTEALRDE